MASTYLRRPCKHVQKVYKIFRLLIGVPDDSSGFFPFFFKK